MNLGLASFIDAIGRNLQFPMPQEEDKSKMLKTILDYQLKKQMAEKQGIREDLRLKTAWLGVLKDWGIFDLMRAKKFSDIEMAAIATKLMNSLINNDYEEAFKTVLALQKDIEKPKEKIKSGFDIKRIVDEFKKMLTKKGKSYEEQFLEKPYEELIRKNEYKSTGYWDVSEPIGTANVLPEDIIMQPYNQTKKIKGYEYPY